MKSLAIENQAFIEVIKKIEENPGIGDEKKGDLKGIYLYKFSVENRTYLLTYRIKEGPIELITLGPYNKYYKNKSEDF